MTESRVAATKIEPTFRRGQHLFFALIGLAHGPLTTKIGAAILWLTSATVWSGAWFVIGYMLGYAFQCTRSLAVPTLLHTGHNLLHFAAVWYFNQ